MARHMCACMHAFEHASVFVLFGPSHSFRPNINHSIDQLFAQSMFTVSFPCQVITHFCILEHWYTAPAFIIIWCAMHAYACAGMNVSARMCTRTRAYVCSCASPFVHGRVVGSLAAFVFCRGCFVLVSGPSCQAACVRACMHACRLACTDSGSCLCTHAFCNRH